MLDALAAPGMQPFTFAFFALIGLLLLEIALMLVGLGSDLGIGGAELPDAGAGLAEIPDLPEAALAELDTGLTDAGTAAEASGGVALLRALGLGEAPAMIWLAALALAFAVFGLALQGAMTALLGHPLGAGLASALVAVPAVLAARFLSRLLGRLVPSVETYATRSFHRRLGRVTVGVARRGYPAEVRYADGFGTTHHLMAEPLDGSDEIPAGSEVIILRDRAGKPRLVRLA